VITDPGGGFGGSRKLVAEVLKKEESLSKKEFFQSKSLLPGVDV